MTKHKISFKMVMEVAFLHFALLIYSTCSVFSKIASKYDFFSLSFCTFFCLSLFGLGIYAILWQQVLKKTSLVIAYANKSVVIIWGMLWGTLFFDEKITTNMIIGASIIIIGIIIIGAENG